jgi:hypothetical protein
MNDLDFDVPEFVYRSQLEQTQRSINGETIYTCRLCDVGDIAEGHWRSHVATPNHKRKMELLCKSLELEYTFSTRRRRAIPIKQRIAKLGLQRWRDDVNSKLLDYLLDSRISSNFEVRLALEKYEIMEKISLLELAVWKTACQMSIPPVALRDSLDWHLWLTSGWESKKNKMRQTNAISIIVAHVCTFLKGSITFNIDRPNMD